LHVDNDNTNKVDEEEDEVLMGKSDFTLVKRKVKS